jgi:hypothetical protein
MEGILANHLIMRISLAVLGFVGMAMCTEGIGRVATANRWADPLSIVGYIFGAAALVIIVAGLFGWDLPLITTEWQAILAVFLIIIAKVALTSVRGLPQP